MTLMTLFTGLVYLRLSMSQLYDPAAAVILEVLAWGRNIIQAFTFSKFNFPLFGSFQVHKILKDRR